MIHYRTRYQDDICRFIRSPFSFTSKKVIRVKCINFLGKDEDEEHKMAVLRVAQLVEPYVDKVTVNVTKT